MAGFQGWESELDAHYADEERTSRNRKERVKLSVDGIDDGPIDAPATASTAENTSCVSDGDWESLLDSMAKKQLRPTVVRAASSATDVGTPATNDPTKNWEFEIDREVTAIAEQRLQERLLRFQIEQKKREEEDIAATARRERLYMEWEEWGEKVSTKAASPIQSQQSAESSPAGPPGRGNDSPLPPSSSGRAAATNERVEKTSSHASPIPKPTSEALGTDDGPHPTSSHLSTPSSEGIADSKSDKGMADQQEQRPDNAVDAPTTETPEGTPSISAGASTNDADETTAEANDAAVRPQANDNGGGCCALQ